MMTSGTLSHLRALFRGPDETALGQYTPVDPADALSEAKTLELKMNRLVSSEITGDYSSAFLGQGLSFAELREYQPGDDPRFINWSVTARFGKPYIKLFREERQLRVMIAIDCSRSMCFEERYETALSFAALLSAICRKNRDQVGLAFFSNGLTKFIAPGASRTHYRKILFDLTQQANFEQHTDFSKSFSELRELLPKRSALFILSDFEGEYGIEDLQPLAYTNQVSCIYLPGQHTSLSTIQGAVRICAAEGEGRSIFAQSPKQKETLLQTEAAVRWNKLSSAMQNAGVSIVPFEHSATKTLQALSHTWRKRRR